MSAIQTDADLEACLGVAGLLQPIGNRRFLHVHAEAGKFQNDFHVLADSVAMISRTVAAMLFSINWCAKFAKTVTPKTSACTA